MAVPAAAAKPARGPGAVRAVCLALLGLVAAACDGAAPVKAVPLESDACNPACAEGELCVEVVPGRTACLAPETAACLGRACEACALEPHARGCGAPEDASGDPGLDCVGYDACLATCAADGPACGIVCRSQATPEAARDHEALVTCGEDAGCADWACTAAACPKAWDTCLGGPP